MSRKVAKEASTTSVHICLTVYNLFQVSKEPAKKPAAKLTSKVSPKKATKAKPAEAKPKDKIEKLKVKMLNMFKYCQFSSRKA